MKNYLRALSLIVVCFGLHSSASFAQDLPKWGRSGRHWGEIFKIDVYSPATNKDAARKNKLIKDVWLNVYSCIQVKSTEPKCSYEYWGYYSNSIEVDVNNAVVCRSLPKVSNFQTTEDIDLFSNKITFQEELGKTFVRQKEVGGRKIRYDISSVSDPLCVTLND